MSAATGHQPGTPYAFDNDAAHADVLLGSLGEMLDEYTTARLTRIGVAAGARCLEVGAGAGTIAAWLADRVGPDGEVIATDVKPQHVRPHPRLTIMRHDVAVDPMPAGSFDLIHARAVLQHVPQRHEVLARLAGSLAPGGVLLVEELEAQWATTVLDTPDPRAHDVFAAYERGIRAVLQANGNDIAWCRHVHAAMAGIGLTRVETEAWQRSWSGGTGVCLLAHFGSRELAPQLLEAGMAAEDLRLLADLTLDPRLAMLGIPLLSTSGVRAE
ncbi:class I SAM-dependent methyltransferase [Nonomuraea gerenzanensis]|uniref:Methyltransferase n=1 Tax=Nonomuraea gerenzanensis TaxID=93944 RepID=A0A1M4EC63_9ACTN|nr:methyltransferase domain-containing protein [Nonomuraea gerenzanensis]UBU18691.1 methyltransferase domain-containing protein [Nonomuraea gerenzanensis]SBO96551.1 methyltransferase [Nonomuraea gerenzanensis]